MGNRAREEKEETINDLDDFTLGRRDCGHLYNLQGHGLPAGPMTIL